MTSTPCPRCGGNGEVRLYEVPATGERLRVCSECEAAWPPHVPLDVEHMQDVTAYGVHANWSLLRPDDR